MFLKIMYGDNVPDGDGSKPHRLIETTQYEYFRNANGERVLSWILKDGTTEHVMPINGNVYVMNDEGKTINTFHLPLG